MNTFVTTSGVGIEVETSDINVAALIELINKTTETKQNILLEGIDLTNEELTLEDFEAYDCVLEIIIECLDEIANTESFVHREDDDGCHYILFADAAPWEYTPRERKLSRKDVEGYLNLLKDVVPDMEIDNLYIANYIQD